MSFIFFRSALIPCCCPLPLQALALNCCLVMLAAVVYTGLGNRDPIFFMAARICPAFPQQLERLPAQRWAFP